ncbi:MAG: hypothetical protein ACI4VF_10690 [Lachnospirales bacterium]
MIAIRYYENIIIDSNVDLTLSEIKELISKGISVFDMYLICVSSLGNGIMEIISLKDALKEINFSKNYGIIAISYGEDSIYKIFIDIITNWINDNKDLKFIKNYYNNRCF